MKKGMFALLLSLCLLLSCMPGASALEGPAPAAGDAVYFGEYEGAPIRWLVLDGKATNTGEPGLFLLSQYALAQTYYGDVSSHWNDSWAAGWCVELLGSSFTQTEQAAMPIVNKTEGRFQAYGLTWGEVSLANEKLFFLSAQEAVDYIGPEDGSPGLSAFTVDGEPVCYWLRTPHGFHPDYVGLVQEENRVHDHLVYANYWTRPATNLSREALLFFSPAETELPVGDLAPLPVPEDGAWRPTLVNSGFLFDVEGLEWQDGQLMIHYSGAEPGMYVSALVHDEAGNLLSYGRLAQAEAPSGLAPLPEGLPEGSRLSVFAERENGPEHSNEASAPVEVDWTNPPPAPEPTPEQVETPSSQPTPGEDVPPASPGDRPAETQGAARVWQFFIRQWMFAIPFLLFSALAVVLAVVQAVQRWWHRRKKRRAGR